MEEEDIRSELCLLIQRSDEPLANLDNELRRNHGLRSLLHLRREEARKDINNMVKSLIERINELQTDLLDEVSEVTKLKVSSVFQKKDDMTQLKSSLQKEINFVSFLCVKKNLVLYLSFFHE